MLSKDRAILCAAYALEKKALEVRVLEVKGLSTLTDYLLIASGSSDRQVQAVAEAVRAGLKDEHATPPMAVEGMKEGRWILLDYGDVMVHIFHKPVRDFYDLDGLWSEAPEVEIPEEYHWERKAKAH
ncbi:ribosome silencing factor RsfS [Desulfuromonas soudanensis]|uniref:Ribosomal silencing factor RsfS n=1 Tax=Desulfuromonas soudanensis TaxID=1603606 RepID=A0A0M4DF39_9BACT|nr:ribosome silencing factor [Desulfuromonas soudanensis]ALC15287.1 ribosome silencing factor RsfS [Desulfuromonas soudanensis]